MRRLFQNGFPLVGIFQSRQPGHGFNPAQPGADAGFGDNLELADFTGRLHMGTAAQFLGNIADNNHTHFFTVFFAEQGHGPHLLGHFLAGFDCADMCIRQNRPVNV